MTDIPKFKALRLLAIGLLVGPMVANASIRTFEYSGQIVGVGAALIGGVPISEGDQWSLRYPAASG